MKSKTQSAPVSTGIFQLKVTLLETNPPVWRRIQVPNCTLDALHGYVQTAMGWENSHLHQFEIGKKCFGNPELLDDGFLDSRCEDSTKTMLTDILPKNGRSFSFAYEYDFGDSWTHEIEFEKMVEPEDKQKYPICLEGARACPPEDVGGVWGFQDFLEAIADPNHEQHDEFCDWAEDFEPEKFDPAKTTKKMRKGLPDWR
jgi:hypothetical protein